MKFRKIVFTLVLLINVTVSFSQWTRVRQLPSTDISSFYSKGNSLYAGGKNIIYFSTDKGQSWDSTSPIPALRLVDNIIVYKNELYAASFGLGVYKSPDGGNTWQNISASIFPFVSDFSEWRGNLYAATLGSSVFKLDSVNRNNWVLFSNGLSNLSLNLNSITGNSNALVAGTIANGLYDYLPAGSTNWEERTLLGQISPTEGVHDIITAHDSLFLAGSSGSFYLSTDNGFTWNKFGNRLTTSFNCLANAREALLVANNNFDGTNNTSFYYIKKDALRGSFVNFSDVRDLFTYRIEIAGDKLWDASTKGLFYMALSDLPGISSADSIDIPLPVRFIDFDVQLLSNKTAFVQWKTGDELNVGHYEVERSADGVTWNSLTNVLPRSSHEYSYTDPSLGKGINYYRIKETDIDGHFSYSVIKSVMVEDQTNFLVWPNPVSDILHAQLPYAKGALQIIDVSGRILFSNIISSNNINIPTLQLTPGEYFLRINNGNTTRVERFIKQ